MADYLFRFLAAATIAATLLWPVVALGIRGLRPRGSAMIVVIFASTVLPALIAGSRIGLVPFPLRGPIQSRYIEAVSVYAPSPEPIESRSIVAGDYPNGTGSIPRQSTRRFSGQTNGSSVRYLMKSLI
jgi:hypothetical protein